MLKEAQVPSLGKAVGQGAEAKVFREKLNLVPSLLPQRRPGLMTGNLLGNREDQATDLRVEVLPEQEKESAEREVLPDEKDQNHENPLPVAVAAEVPSTPEEPGTRAGVQTEVPRTQPETSTNVRRAFPEMSP